MSKKLSHETSEVKGDEVVDSLESDNVIFDIDANTKVVLTGPSHLQDDSVTNSGQMRNRGDAVIDGLELHDGATFTNAGTVTDNRGVTLGVNATDAVTVRNVAGATWTLGQSAVIASAGASRFVNLGELRNEAGSDDTNNATLVQRGKLHIDGKLNQVGVTRVFGDIEGEGEIDFKRAVLHDDHVDVKSWSAETAVINGHVTSSANSVDAHRVVMAAGSQLDLTGTALVLGEASTFIGQGTVNVTGSATISDVTLRTGVNFVNSGQILVASPDGGQDHVTLSAAAAGGANIEISNLAGATWTDAAAGGTRISDRSNGGTADFANSGVFIDASYGGTDFDIAVVNNGVIQQAAFDTTGLGSGNGHITFERALTGAGTVDVGPGSVEVNGAAAAGQTFAFQPNPAAETRLTLNDVQEFNAAISGFDQNGAVGDVLVVNTANFAFEAFVADADGMGGSLMFSNGAAETAVHLLGSYDAASFHAVVSGSQTAITYG